MALRKDKQDWLLELITEMRMLNWIVAIKGIEKIWIEEKYRAEKKQMTGELVAHPNRQTAEEKRSIYFANCSLHI